MKSMSCRMGRSSFGMLLVILLSFLALSLPVQSCRLNQNVLVQAASMNQRGQSETNRLNLPDREGADKPSFKSFIPQSENMSPASIGDQQLEKAEVIQKTKKLQMPFIANEGQTDEKVRFYANTFGGTVFVTKDGEIVYALPMVEHASPLVHYDIDKNETGYTGLTGYRGKEGQCIVHRTLCAMYPYCPWNFPVYYSETNSLLKRGTHPLIPSREGNGVCNTTPTTRRDTERRVPTTTVALKEQFVGAKVKAIQGEEKSVTKVNYFKGKDASKWKTDISTYDVINLGEVYDGIELKLKAYGSNVEKLFCVKPGANPEQIKISLSGIQPSENPSPLSPFVRGTGGCPPLAGAGGGLGASLPVRDRTQTGGLWVNDEGQLEVETELGPVKFTKPVAYQEIDGKRVEVEVAYQIENCKLQNAEQGITHPLPLSRGECKSPLSGGDSGVGCVKPVLSFVEGRIAPNRNGLNQLNGLESRGKRLIGSREKGMGRKGAYITSNSQLTTGNLQPGIKNPSPDTRHSSLSTQPSSPTYSFAVASYDKSHDLIIDPLLASTFLGGSTGDCGYSIALDTSGNVYVTGSTSSTDFPTTSGAYDTSYNSNADAFISKLSGDLTSLIASTFLGGSSSDFGESIATDSEGNVYMTGHTSSLNFPTTPDAYDTSFNGDSDVFVAKLNGDLTSLLASTFIGGSNGESSLSIVIGSSGDLFVGGNTNSTNFPTTPGAYDTSFNGVADAFVSKLNGDLTTLLASTYLGGSDSDSGRIAIDSDGNIYVAGSTLSLDFPTTPSAYDTSLSGFTDAFVSKLNGGLTTLIASTYLGGSSYEGCSNIAIDQSGNVYVIGYTYSTNFPTTLRAYDTSFNGGLTDIFVSKLNSGLTSVLASTYLGGADTDSAYSITINEGGNIYVIGPTDSIDFPTTSGAYDTSFNGDYSNAFISRFDGALQNLLSSTYLGGSIRASGNVILPNSLAINKDENVYLTGGTDSTDFPTTPDAYDTSFNSGSMDAFVSKLDKNLSAPDETLPTITTTSPTNGATNVSINSEITATFSEAMDASSINDTTFTMSEVTGIVTYDGTTATFTPSSPFAYSTMYTATITTGVMDMAGNHMVSDYTWSFITVSLPLSPTPTSFVIPTPTPMATVIITPTSTHIPTPIPITTPSLTPTPLITPTPFITPPITPSPLPSPTAEMGMIYGYVVDADGNPIESVNLKLKGKKTKTKETIYTDANGFFEFKNLEADTYELNTKKKHYKKTKQEIKIGKGEKKEIEITMEKDDPTAITLIFFSANASIGGVVTLTWETATEVNNAGFNIYCSKNKNDNYTKVNSTLVPAEGNSTIGASYRFEDTPGKGIFNYKLEDIDNKGVITMHGNVKVRLGPDNNKVHRG